MIKTVLITGGTGFVGRVLVKSLLQKGFRINLLVRNEDTGPESPNLRIFKWDVYKGYIDNKCIQNADAIIHLAGEEIAAKRWTDDRKRQIAQSRTKSIRLIYDLLLKSKNQVNHIISASAIGYYGDRNNEVLTEESLPAKDFLAETCVQWEEAIDEGERLGLRIVKLRSGIILGKSGGVLPQMEQSMYFGFAVIPGSGNQWVSWIHIKDAINIYTYALQNETMKGVYNMASPHPVTLEEMTHSIARAMEKSPIFFYAPEFALKIAVGEMSLMVLESIKVSSEKLQKSEYTFEYPEIKAALDQIYKSKLADRISDDRWRRFIA